MSKTVMDKKLCIRIILCACFLLLSGMLMVFLYLRDSHKDRTPPVFYIYGEDPKYTEGDSLDELIVRIRAVDDVDGMVSKSIRVRNIYFVEGTDRAVVTYAAKDQSNNIGSISRNVTVERIGQETEAAEENPAAETTAVENPVQENPAAENIGE